MTLGIEDTISRWSLHDINNPNLYKLKNLYENNVQDQEQHKHKFIDPLLEEVYIYSM